MKEMPVTTAVVLTLTMLLLAPLEANAGGRGGGMGFGGGVRVGGGVSGQHVPIFGRAGSGVSGQHVAIFGRNFLARRHFRSFRDQNNFGSWWPWYGYSAPYTYDDDYSMAYQTAPDSRETSSTAG